MPPGSPSRAPDGVFGARSRVEALVRDALTEVIQHGSLGACMVPSFTVESPRHAAFGDLACDVALVLGRQLGACPQTIGAAIAERVRDPHGWLAEVTVGGPGFVNFRFAPPFWQALLTQAVEAGERYGRSEIGRGLRYRVELRCAAADATALRAAASADAVAGLLRDAGAEVEQIGSLSGFPEDAAVDAEAPDGVVGVIAGREESAAPQAAAARGTVMRLLAVQPVRVSRDGAPVREIGARDVVQEIGWEACRFLLLLGRADRTLELDLELAKRQRIENPLFLVQYAHARLARRRHAGSARDRAGTADDPATLAACDGDALRAVASWPDLVETATRALEPDRVARFAVELGLVVHRWLNRRGTVDGRMAAATRDVLAGCLERMLRRALTICGVSAPERM
jgi:arginyl-tRNA synthetase